MSNLIHLHHGRRPPRGQERVPLSRLHEGRFGRMFRKLGPAPEHGEEKLKTLADAMVDNDAPQGGWGGEAQTGDNPRIPSGYTYFGQFVDHDITFDPASELGKRNDPDALVDFRSPRFDLDSVYGSGPADEPFQYDRASGNRKFLIGSIESGEEDLPRNRDEIALIGDPRNDENIIVSQLQLQFLKAHNRFVDEVAAEGLPEGDQFTEAQKRLRWHYQWIVVNDFLRLITPDGFLDNFEVQHFTPKKNPFMPVEFSVAGYRFGHSQVRTSYNLNDVVIDRPIFLSGEVGPLDDLRGFRVLPGQWTIDWDQYLVIDGSNPQLSRLIDTKLAAGLFSLPGSDRSLALRNLLRGEALGLPSGQDVAQLLGQPPIPPEQLGTELVPTPLWFYVLKEAEIGGGQHLGPVGATIVAEVLLGLLDLDPSSWLNQEPTWQPTIIQAGDGLALADLVRFAQGQ